MREQPTIDKLSEGYISNNTSNVIERDTPTEKLDFSAILSIAIIPQTVDLIVKNEGLDGIFAITEFYQSKTYELLAKEETKLWHYSPMTLYSMWKHERETGEVVFPEEV